MMKIKAKSSLMWRKSTALVLILGFLPGCASSPPAIKDWCVHDRWQCWSHSDTAETIRQINEHNMGLSIVCPELQHNCK